MPIALLHPRLMFYVLYFLCAAYALLAAYFFTLLATAVDAAVCGAALAARL